MGDDGPRIPDLLIGLAPTAASTCHRCGAATTTLANGRGRLDFCGRCRTLDVVDSDGLALASLRDSSNWPGVRADPLPRPFRAFAGQDKE